MSAAIPIFDLGLLCTEILFQQQRGALGCDDLLADTTMHDSIAAMAAASVAMVGAGRLYQSVCRWEDM